MVEVAVAEEVFAHLLQLLLLFRGERGAHVEAKVDGGFGLVHAGGLDLRELLVDGAAVRVLGGEQLVQFEFPHLYIGAIANLTFAELEGLGANLIGLVGGDADAGAEVWIPDHAGEHELAVHVSPLHAGSAAALPGAVVMPVGMAIHGMGSVGGMGSVEGLGSVGSGRRRSGGRRSGGLTEGQCRTDGERQESDSQFGMNSHSGIS